MPYSFERRLENHVINEKYLLKLCCGTSQQFSIEEERKVLIEELNILQEKLGNLQITLDNLELRASMYAFPKPPEILIPINKAEQEKQETKQKIQEVKEKLMKVFLTNYPFVEVQKGKFIMGTSAKQIAAIPDWNQEKYGDEISNENEYLETFKLGMYPITNADYEIFVCVGGYDIQDHWTKEGWEWRLTNRIQKPLCWDERKNMGNHPVLGVSFYEALAFAKWVKKNLPTEKQWEKAARGTSGQLYPWGNYWKSTCCNYLGSADPYKTSTVLLHEKNSIHIFPGGTTPVTNYNCSQSPYNIYDMVGNLYEWCNDVYPDIYKDKEEPRYILKGGCWLDQNPLRFRAAFKSSKEAKLQDVRIGFRLCDKV